MLQNSNSYHVNHLFDHIHVGHEKEISLIIIHWPRYNYNLHAYINYKRKEIIHQPQYNQRTHFYQ